MTLRELHRALFSKARLLLLLVLLLVSLLWLHASGSPYRENNVQAKYDAQLEHYRTMSLAEARAEIDTIVSGGDLLSGLDYAYISPQIDYLMGFEENIAAILTRAENMSTVSIFAGSPYSQANIRKTASDYSRLQGLNITMGNDLPVQRVLYNTLSDWLACAFMLAVVYSFLAERKRGLWNVVCASPNGRGSLVLWRFGAVAATAVLSGMVFTAAEVLYAYSAHGGWDELDRIVQSISDYSNWTVPMTIGQMWLVFLLLRVAGLFVVGMTAWFLLELIADRRLISAVWTAVTGAEYLLTRLSEGNLLRHINLFTFMQPRKLLTTYINLNFFGQPTGQLTAIAISGAIAVPVMLVVILLLYHSRKPVDSYHWLDILLDKLNKITAPLGIHTSLLGHELYRTVITGKGWLILTSAFLAAVLIASPTVTAGGEVDMYLESYYRQSQGPVNEETDAYLTQRQQRLADLHAQRDELLVQYQAGEISADEYSARSMAFSELGKQAYALEQYAARLEELKQTDGSYILPHWVFESLLGVRGDETNTIIVISSVAVVLLFAALAGAEKRTGMLRSRKATPRGRKEIRLHRHGAAWMVSVLFGTSLWGMYIIRLWRDYGELPWLNAPVRCLSFMEGITSDISIIGCYLLLAGLRTLFLCLLSSLVLIIMEVRDSHGT